MDGKLKDLFQVGVVVGTHGLRGDLKVRALPHGDLALPAARSVFIEDSEGRLTRYETVRTSQNKKNILLRLAGLDSLDAVAALVGASVWMARTDLPELDGGQYYWFDLEGLEVVDQKLGSIGHVVGMFSTPAHDILEVDGEQGEILIPAIAPFLVRVDRDKGLLHVNLPEGLVPETGATP
jgi:16S rRNA processing protein RimM